jgi:hypothetical protein
MSLCHPIRSIQTPTQLPLVTIVHANTDFPFGQTDMANASVDSCLRRTPSIFLLMFLGQYCTTFSVPLNQRSVLQQSIIVPE